MKKFFVRLFLLLAVLLAGLAALWYTRPMTLQQLCPELDLAQCSAKFLPELCNLHIHTPNS